MMVAVKKLGPNTLAAILSITGLKLTYYKEERKIIIEYEPEHATISLWPGEQSFIVFMGMIRGFFHKQNTIINELTQGVISVLQEAGDLQ